MLGFFIGAVGCVPVRQSGEPLTPLSLADVNATDTLGSQTQRAEWDAQAWGFGDPQLVKLIDQGIAHSPHFAEAWARVRKAEAVVGEERASTKPDVSVDGNVSEAQASRNIGFPSQFSSFLPKGLHSNTRVVLGGNWDFDLVGRNRAVLAAAVSDAAAVDYDLAQARLVLMTSIAQAYAEYARALADVQTGQTLHKLSEEQLRLYRLRVKARLDDETNVDAARRADLAAQDNLASAQEAERIARYRLAALVGEGPDFGATLAAPELHLSDVELDQLGADVIASRPDVAAAKARIEGHAARVKVVQRDFYPNISLNALAGLQSFDLGQILLGSSSIASFGPAIHLPIFTGKLRAIYREQQADYDGAVAAYNASIVGAFQDVATSFAQSHMAEARLSAAQATERVAAREEMLMEARVRAQLVSELATTVTRQTLVIAQAHVATARVELILSQIDVMRALGGRLVDVSPRGKL